MKVLWLNDALTVRPENENERSALATLLSVLETAGMVEAPAPTTGYETEADHP